MTNFDAERELAAIRKELTSKKRRVRRSKLDRYQQPLLSLRRAGGSLSELQEFLRVRHIDCEPSTISRWLKNNGA